MQFVTEDVGSDSVVWVWLSFQVDSSSEGARLPERLRTSRYYGLARFEDRLLFKMWLPRVAPANSPIPDLSYQRARNSMFGISLSRAHPRTRDMHSVQGSHQNEVTCSAARIAGHDVFRRQSTAYLTLCCALVVVWSQLNICSKPGLFLRSVSCVRCGKINGTGFRCFLREAYIQTRAYFHVL